MHCRHWFFRNNSAYSQESLRSGFVTNMFENYKEPECLFFNGEHGADAQEPRNARGALAGCAILSNN